MKKICFFLSLIVINYFLISCSEKKIWKLAEPSLVIDPIFKGNHKKTNKNTNQHTSVKNKVPYSIGVSQFKNFLNLHLNLNSQLHFQNKDIGLILKVTNSCAIKEFNNPKLIYITHIAKIKIKKKLSFVSFFPKEILNIYTTSLKCHLAFLVKTRLGDRHSFKLSQKMIEIKTLSKNADINNNAITLKIFKSKYKKNAKETQILANPYIREANLDQFYIKVINKSESLQLQCNNKELNTIINLKTFNHKHFFLSEFIEDKTINRHDINANVPCKIIKRDSLNNIIQTYEFIISLSNITQTIKPRPRPYKACPAGGADLGNGQCVPI